MANNLSELSDLTARISDSFGELEAAKGKEREEIKKGLLEMQKKRDQLITKLKTELVK
jgi:predicted  nucleic acid-binding Zn-ribbon protein